MRSAVALLTWVIVKVSVPMDEIRQEPAPNSVPALAVVGTNIGTEPVIFSAKFGAEHVPASVVTTVVAEPGVSVTVPTAFERPAANC